MASTTSELHDKFEPTPNAQALTGSGDEAPPHNVSKDVDYEPHPELSMKISPEHEAIIKHITNLYSGSCSEGDMQVYAEKAIYDDPLSYCDTRYKIAGKSYHILQLCFHSLSMLSFYSTGQWYGLPKV